MNKTISISLYNRLKYTKVVLENLNNCFDIENYKIFICCEPSNNEVIQLAKEFRPKQTTVLVNNSILGCNKNIYQCLAIGFEMNTFHIHIEDDTVPGRDFLDYCEYCRNKFKNDKEILTISGYSRDSGDHCNFIKKNKWFTPWGWASWKDRWEQYIKPAFRLSFQSKNSWDIFVNEAREEKFELRPLVARTQNIGAENGTHCPDANYHFHIQYNENWINNHKLYQKEFKLIDDIN